MTRLEKIISDINAGLYRNRQMGDLDEYELHLKNMKAIRHPYATKVYGHSAVIYTKNLSGEKTAYVYFEGKLGQGYHICNLVKKDIEDWIRKNKGFDYKRYESPDYLEQTFNLEKIERNIGKPMLGIDVNGCYFDTLFKLGYITQRVYDMAHKKKEEWKTGRNASVGMLAKEVVYTFYDFKDGTRKRVETIVASDKRKKAIRHHIIGHVWKTFQELFKWLDEDFYMFLTDCIYTDPKRLKKVTDFFIGKGYGTKSKPYKLTKLDRDIKRVTWWDKNKPKKKNKKGKVLKRGDFKWYNYADDQIYKPKTKKQ